MITFDQAADLMLLISLSVLASGAGVLLFGPHRWTAMIRPMGASLLLAVFVPILAVLAFGMRWNTFVLALAVVAIAFVAAFTQHQPSTTPNDDWP